MLRQKRPVYCRTGHSNVVRWDNYVWRVRRVDIGGRAVEIPVRVSRRARKLSIHVDVLRNVEIVVPPRTSQDDIDRLLFEHRAWLEADGELEARRRRNLASEVFQVASNRARRHIERAVQDDPELQRLLDEVQARRLDPLTAVREILQKVFHVGDPDGSDAP